MNNNSDFKALEDGMESVEPTLVCCDVSLIIVWLLFMTLRVESRSSHLLLICTPDLRTPLLLKFFSIEI